MHSEPLCHADERLDDLQNGLRILQKPDAFRFGMDAVLLAHFARLRPRDRVADLGTGTGILPLLLSLAEPTAHLVGLEWQADMADMARRSVKMNGLEDRVEIMTDDLRNAPQKLGHECMNGVICNPPYGKRGASLISETDTHALARHESDCVLQDILHTASALLRNQGRLWMVFPAPRALELLDGLRQQRLEPKRIRMVCAKATKAPYLLLIEAVKNAKPMLHWLAPLVVYHENGSETEELKSIYSGPSGLRGRQYGPGCDPTTGSEKSDG